MDKEVKYLSKGGLDADSVNIAVGLNDWVNSENVRTGSTDKGFTERMESIGGTTQISTPQPSVTFLELGSVSDNENNLIAYFKYNTTGVEHRIMAYDSVSNTDYLVLLSSQITGGLNFNKNFPIHSAKIINGLLYWVEGTNNEPRKINLYSAIKANNPSYVTDQQPYTFPLLAEEITIIKPPPPYAPILQKSTDTSFNNNFIANDSFEGAFEFVYWDNEETVTGVYSQASRLNFTTDTYNRITFTMVNGQNIPDTVRIVNLVVRVGDGSSGGGNIAKVIKTWDKKNAGDAAEIAAQVAGTTLLTFNFYNNTTGAFLDAAKVLKPFDNVPIYSQTLEAAKNRIFLANNTEGYDTPTETSLYVTLPNSIVLGSSTNKFAVWLFGGQVYQSGVYFGWYVYLTVGTTQGWYVVTANQSYVGSLTIPAATLALSAFTFMGTTITEVKQSIVRNSPLPNTTGITLLQAVYPLYNSVTITGLAALTYNCMLPKSSYKYGMVFYDYAMRKCAVANNGSIGVIYTELASTYESGVLTNEIYLTSTVVQNIGVGFEIQIVTGAGAGTYTVTGVFPANTTTPINSITVSGTFPASGLTTSNIIVSRVNSEIGISTPARNYAFSQAVPFINWNLSNDNAVNEIPDWAVYYAPVRTLNLRTRFFLDSVITSSNPAKYVTKNPNTDVYVFNNNNFSNATVGIGLDSSAISKAQLGYVFNQGDVCILTRSDNTVYEIPVIGQSGKYIILKPQDIGTLTNKSFVFEIYTPYLQSTQEIYYEVGQLYPINNAGTADREYSQLLGVFAPDTYALTRNFTTTTYYASTMSPNDLFWQRWDNDGGKTNIVSLLGQTTKTQYISWSDVFIPNTAINGLSSFEFLNQKAVPQDCGSITKLMLTSKVQEEGTIMLAICNEETASLYLEETRITDSTGATQFLGSSTETIGTINVMKGSFGSINPESVTEYRGSVFWFDANNGRFLQYSVNGLFPISNYKMVRFWKLWAAKYKSMTAAEIEAFGCRPFVFTIVDSSHNELLISIPKLSNTPPKGYLPDYPNTIYPFDILDYQAKTIVYSLGTPTIEPHWQGAFTFYAEGFATLQNKLYSFKYGNLYIHNQDNQNQFYGVQYTSKVMVTSNQMPMDLKVYNNLSIQSNLKPIFAYLYNEYPYVQASDLEDISFLAQEGIWWALILRNKIVPTASGYTTDGLLTAEKMRNTAMYIMLEFNPTTQPLGLLFLQIGYQRSLGNNV